MTLPSGGHARLDNDWLASFVRTLPIAEGVLLYLQAKGNLHRKGADLGELVSAVGNRDLRSIGRVIEKLLGRGQVAQVEGLYYAPQFVPSAAPGEASEPQAAQSPVEAQVNPPAASPATRPGVSPGISSNTQEESVRQDDENGDETAPERREGREEEKTDQNTPLTPQGGERVREAREGSKPTPPHPRRRRTDLAPPLPDLPAALAEWPEFPAAWADWLEYRRQRKLETVAATAAAQLERLLEFKGEGYDPAYVLRECIAHAWRGVFRPRDKTGGPPPNLVLDPPTPDPDAATPTMAELLAAVSAEPSRRRP